jgi:hypothetical protein
MAFCRCPKCKALFTVQVDGEKKWRSEKWPGLAATELVPETCPACLKKAHDLEVERDASRQPSPFDRP